MFLGILRSLHGIVKGFPQRCISTETAAALKQLYFAVHPDLFGKFPRQQLINEESLKKLNSYISEVTAGAACEPLNLQFYLRSSSPDSENADELQFVNITLNTDNVGQAVYQILQSCGLPCQELQSYPTSKRKIVWDFDQHFQFGAHVRKEESMSPKVSPLTSLKDFLSNTGSVARERLVNLKDIKTENAKVFDKICKELNLSQVTVDCGFGCLPIQGLLRNSYHLFNRNKDSIPDLSGRVLVFGGNVTCVNALGQIVLSVEDVPHNWLKLLRCLSDYDVLVAEVPIWEKRLSKRLGNISIVHDHELPCMPVTDYLQQMNKLLLRLKSAELKSSSPNSYLVKPRSFCELHAAVLSSCDSIQLSPSGQFRIPGSCLPEILVDFLLKNKEYSLEKREEYERDAAEEKELIEQCKQELGLAALSRDSSLTHLQMKKCCTNLLDVFDSQMKDLIIKVTHSYHLSEDGDISIPWNWR